MINSRRPLLWVATVLLASSASAKTVIDELSVTADDRGAYHLVSRFFVETSSATVWQVLTDYDRIDDFVPSVKRSEAKERRGEELVLEQQWVTRVLVFARTFHVRLAIREEAEARILFRDLSGKDFEFYEGSWRIEPSNQGVWVQYKLRAKPVFSVPRFVARKMFKKAAEDLLSEVRLEIMRRGAQTAGASPR